jgi:hypothetical protein
MGKFNNFALTPLEAPCRKCDKRQINCHSTCDGYKQFNKANEALRAKKLQKIHISDTLNRNKLNRFSNMKSNGSKLKHGSRRGA